MPLPSSLFAYIHRCRDAGEPWRAIAESLGVSRQAVDQWLRGSAVPTRTVLILAGLLLRQRDAARVGEWPAIGG